MVALQCLHYVSLQFLRYSMARVQTLHYCLLLIYIQGQGLMKGSDWRHAVWRAPCEDWPLCNCCLLRIDPSTACVSCCRFKVVDMLQDYQMGPFTVTPLRVTHSIPDCCGLIMRR